MPRNGSDGTYALSDTIAPATLADANELQAILNDLAAETTVSIAKDGQTPITGQLKGLVSANPGHSFNGDLNTGLGSDTADELYLMCGGTKIAKASAAGFDVLSGALLVAGNAAVPTGTGPIPYAGATAPATWVLAHGGSIGDGSSGATVRANADCLALFTLIYNTANQSNGEGQVQDSAGTNTARGANAAADFAAHKRILLADMSDRDARGKGGSTSYGQTQGNDTVTVAQANLPAVNFTHSGTTLADGGHGHSDTGHGHQVHYSTANMAAGVNPVAATVNVGQPIAGNADASNAVITSNASNITVSAQGVAASGGSGTALDIKPKQLVKSFIIKL